jgi:NADPH:quinone reductase-like Zn-dependent oxidoreductase
MPGMKTVVMHAPGGPEVLKIERRPIPTPGAGEVLIRVKAFGINRSELFTRQGHSPGVRFPRILGIEATGPVESAPGGEFQPGETVATVMGGMGRAFDGGYAEYTCVPAAQVRRVRTSLSWEQLGALPEMLQTAWGALFKALRLQPGERLLIRGGTTSVGLAAGAIARSHGALVSATTRRAEREQSLRDSGADQVFIDTGSIAEQVRQANPGGVHKVLDLVGATTLLDSLQCAKPQGIVCMSGMVGDQWTLAEFEPMAAIPTAVSLTTYSGGVEDFMAMPLQQLVEQVEAGSLKIHIGKVFHIDQIVDAHIAMEANAAGGKIVILT